MTDESKHFKVHVLASGSRGNATVITYGDAAVLIDAGISAKRITEGMREVGIGMNQLRGICITHEHSDHVAGLPQMLKRFDVPVFTKKETWQAMGEKVAPYNKRLHAMTRHLLDIDDLTLEAFSLSHDAANPIGFSCYGGHEKVTLMTDTGKIDDAMLGHLDESTMLILEANHDVQMLRYGPYMASLKQRVEGPLGHLCNEIAAQALVMMKRPPHLQVVLAHRSEQNNTVEKVGTAMSQILHSEGIQIGSDVMLVHGQQKSTVTLLPQYGQDQDIES